MKYGESLAFLGESTLNNSAQSIITMSDTKNNSTPKPGDGLRSLKSTMLFRAINYELYVRPNMIIMALGGAAIVGCAGYIIYMRSKYEGMGYYSAIESDGKETFKKKTSKWND